MCILILLSIGPYHKERGDQTNAPAYCEPHWNQKCHLYLPLVPSGGPEKVVLPDEQNRQKRCSKHSHQRKIPCGSPAPRLCSAARNAGDVRASYRRQKNSQEDRHTFACGLTHKVRHSRRRLRYDGTRKQRISYGLENEWDGGCCLHRFVGPFEWSKL